MSNQSYNGDNRQPSGSRGGPPTSLSLPQHERSNNQSPSPILTTSNQSLTPTTTTIPIPILSQTTPINVAQNNDLKRPLGLPLSNDPSPGKRMKLEMNPIPFHPHNSSSPLSSLPPSQHHSIPRSSQPLPVPSSSYTSTITPSNPPLPLPLLLLNYAQLLHNSALALEPYLAQSKLPIQVYTTKWNEYQRFEMGAIVVLRNLIAGGGGIGIGGGRLELRARIMLVEILSKTSKDGGEAEKVVAKGLSAAQKHEALLPYKYHLYAQQIALALKSSNSKYAKTILKRVISELSPITSPRWLYHFQLTLYSLCCEERDYPGALSALREVERIAEERGDEEMKWSTKVLITRLALGEGQMGVAEEMIGEVAEMLGYSTASTTPATIPVVDSSLEQSRKKNLGSQMKILFVLCYCLYHAEMGSMKLAKEKLKLVHSLLDETKLAPGEAEGWVEIPILPIPVIIKSSIPSSPSLNPPKTIAPLFVRLSLPSKALVYAFTFLVSVAVQRDPFGTKPRAVIYAAEGLRTINAKLAGIEQLPAPLSLLSIPSTLTILSKIKISLHIFLAELSIMRSQFSSAQSDLSHAIQTSRLLRSTEEGRTSSNLWEDFSPRIILGKGFLYQARGKEEASLECFNTVIEMIEDKMKLTAGTGVGTGGRGMQGLEEVGILAKTSILLVKLGQGFRLRVPGDESSTSTHSMIATSTTTPATENLPQRRQSYNNSGVRPSTAEELYLNDLAFTIITYTQSSPLKSTSTSMKLIGELVSAFTKAEIIKAKVHLSKALTILTDSGANHAKGLVLAMLANLFLQTADVEAQKMLMASLRIARGMGSKTSEDKVKANSTATGIPAKVVGPEGVGNARLGLWLGERLLLSYKKELENCRRDDPLREKKQLLVKEQEELNEAHRFVIKRDGLE